jgi:hypothetical protein
MDLGDEHEETIHWTPVRALALYFATPHNYIFSPLLPIASISAKPTKQWGAKTNYPTRSLIDSGTYCIVTAQVLRMTTSACKYIWRSRISVMRVFITRKPPDKDGPLISIGPSSQSASKTSRPRYVKLSTVPDSSSRPFGSTCLNRCCVVWRITRHPLKLMSGTLESDSRCYVLFDSTQLTSFKAMASKEKPSFLAP